MTVRAERSGDDNIRLAIASGAIEINATEDYRHLGQLWNQLGV